MSVKQILYIFLNCEKNTTNYKNSSFAKIQYLKKKHEK